MCTAFSPQGAKRRVVCAPQDPDQTRPDQTRPHQDQTKATAAAQDDCRLAALLRPCSAHCCCPRTEQRVWPRSDAAIRMRPPLPLDICRQSGSSTRAAASCCHAAAGCLCAHSPRRAARACCHAPGAIPSLPRPRSPATSRGAVPLRDAPQLPAAIKLQTAGRASAPATPGPAGRCSQAGQARAQRVGGPTGPVTTQSR